MKKVIVVLVGAVFLISCSQFSEPQGLSNGNGLNQKTVSGVALDATFASIKTNILDVKCLGCHKVESKSKAKDIPFETEAQVVNGSSDLGALIVPGRPAESMLYRSIVSDEKIRGRAKVMPPKDSPHPAVTPSEQHVIAAWIAGVVVKNEDAEKPAPALPAPPSGEKQQQTPVVPPVEPPVAEMPPAAAAPVQQTAPVVDAAPAMAQPQPPAAANPLPDVVDFALIKTEVLEKKCMTCHKEGGKAEELAFATREELLAVSNSFGQAFVVVGKPEESIFYLSLLKDETLRQDIRLMPPKKDVVAGKAVDSTERDVALIRKWILDGAK